MKVLLGKSQQSIPIKATEKYWPRHEEIVRKVGGA